MGFEPTRIAPPELESGALDRSAKLSLCRVVIDSPILHVPKVIYKGDKTPLAGLEPAIFGLEVQRVIHYATRA